MEDWKDRVNNLRSMAICRFCLDDKAPLHNIFKFDEKPVPLPLQIMACADIEVLKNDAMPQLICDKCKTCTEQAYNFKATCKKSDDALRSYLETEDLRNLRRISLKDLKLQVAKKRQISQELPTPFESELTSPTERRCKLDTISPIKYENENDSTEEVTNHVYTHLYGLRYYCDKCNCSFESEDERDEHEKKHEEMEYGERIEEENESDKIDDGLKCCNQFLKVDLNSDVIDEFIEEEENDDVIVIGGENLKSQEDVIKPIVRSEGTNVYARKTSSLIEKPQNTSIRDLCKDSSQNNLFQNNLFQNNLSQNNLSQNNLSRTPKLTQLTIENFGLTLQDLNSLPTKQYVDMKVGDKKLRVRKLVMTKAEIQAMAKQEKIVLKWNTTLLRKPVQKTKHTMETVVDPKQTLQRPAVKHKYVKKVNGAPKIVKDKSVVGNEDRSQSGEEVILIDD